MDGRQPWSGQPFPRGGGLPPPPVSCRPNSYLSDVPKTPLILPIPVKGVFGTVVNQGDRTLNQVEVTVYFLDQEGNVVGEEDYYPVLVTQYSIGDNKPLKPNYVEDFGYSGGDDAPSTWAGRARAEITDIAFAE